jgi:hypothetical protein
MDLRKSFHRFHDLHCTLSEAFQPPRIQTQHHFWKNFIMTNTIKIDLICAIMMAVIALESGGVVSVDDLLKLGLNDLRDTRRALLDAGVKETDGP